jgi:hypothetical protein
MTTGSWPRVFISSASAIFLITGAAKLSSSASEAQVLQTFDPIFGITLGNLFRVAGGVEVLVALVCLFGQRITLQAALVLWLGVIFLVL